MIAGTIKAFNFTLDDVLYNISYANVILYGATLPSINKKDNKNKVKKEDVIKADDPKNKDKVRRFFENIKD